MAVVQDELLPRCVAGTPALFLEGWDRRIWMKVCLDARIVHPIILFDHVVLVELDDGVCVVQLFSCQIAVADVTVVVVPYEIDLALRGNVFILLVVFMGLVGRSQVIH